MRRIVLRADGSSTVGFGHVYRLISFCELLGHGYQFLFVTAYVNEKIQQELTNIGVPWTLTNPGQEFDLEGIIKEHDIVVIDGYHFDSSYQKKIKERNCVLVCIDDLHDKEFFADLIINHSPTATRAMYNAQAYTKYALGPDYALLRKKFIENSRISIPRKDIKTALICFGGSDPLNITLEAVETLIRFDRLDEINVIIGPGYRDAQSLHFMAESDSRIELYQSISADAIVQIMEKSDLAIVAASGILFESIALNCIPVICYYAENQKEFYTYLIEHLNMTHFDCKNVSKSLTDAVCSVMEGRSRSEIEALRNRFAQADINLNTMIKTLL